jgi:ankyrin repeat protein
MKRNIAGTSLIAAALLFTACHITLFAVEPPSAASAPQSSERQQEQGKALIDAIRKGDHDRVKSLLEDGVDAMSAGGNSPVSPLCVAATRDDEKSVELLLAHGADPNDRDQGDLPLVCSAYQGNLKMVAFLIDHGAKTEPGPGPMPLLAATDTGRVEMVRLGPDQK